MCHVTLLVLLSLFTSSTLFIFRYYNQNNKKIIYEAFTNIEIIKIHAILNYKLIWISLRNFLVYIKPSFVALN